MKNYKIAKTPNMKLLDKIQCHMRFCLSNFLQEDLNVNIGIENLKELWRKTAIYILWLLFNKHILIINQ